MHTASDIAKWFLQRNDIELMLGDSDLISNLKLQKLLYYAQGVFMVIMDEKLFNDDIVAWAHGPVVVSVYHEYKSYGAKGIEYSDELHPLETYSQEEDNILEEVFTHFSQYSAWKLRNMTHKETPWKETERNGVINPQHIKDYFREHYVDETA